MAKGKRKGAGGKGRQQSQKGSQKGSLKVPSGPDTRVESIPKKIPGGHSLPVPGLTNLGNTCFFNAVLQNISQSHYLRVRLECFMSSPSYTTVMRIPGSELSRELSVVDDPGQLTKALSSFLVEMMQHPGNSLNPRPLFTEICRKASRFSSHQQQDSQELLRYLLDSMRSEEINRIKRAILTSFDVAKKDPTGKKITDKDREDIKAYGHEAALARTFVDDVFGGVLVSTVKCNECNSCSSMHETFLDLSLPIPEDKSQPSPGSQARGRKTKKGGKGGNYTYKLMKDEEEIETTSTTKNATMSKHQQKKAKKKQAKEAKRSRIKTKSLQEFLADSEENPKESAQGSKWKKDCSGENAGARTTATEEKEMEIQQENRPENAEGPKDRDNAARATGDEEKEEQEEGNGEGDGMNEAGDGMIKAGGGMIKAGGGMIKAGVGMIEAGGGMIEAGGGMIKAGDGSGSLQPSDEDQPCSGNVESLADGLAAIKVADGCQNGTSCEQKSYQALDTSKEAVVEAVSDSVALFSGESGKNATEQVGSASQHLDIQTEESTEAASKEASSVATLLGENTTAKNLQLDSLRACLKKFCSPELLSGNNKFACTFCTKKKEVIKTKAQHRLSTSSKDKTTTEDVMEVRIEDKEKEKSLSQSTESQHSLVTPPDSTNERCSEETGSAAHKHAEEATTSEVADNQLDEERDAGGGEVLSSEESCPESSHEESMKESDDEDADGVPKKKRKEHKEKESNVVFSEATKQLLIKAPPLVLNLHLKRFLQSGRHLRKNNRHISFPTLLDMRPFCTPHCQSLCDSKGQLLYSLYGVVEHSGGMHGGHYTAYVRVRTPPCYPASTTSKQTDPSEGTLHSDKDVTPQISSPNLELACGNTDVADESETSTSFDLSSTKGHWYYISDSHVRTATESEVLKSQAYLLFYERLPFQHREN